MLPMAHMAAVQVALADARVQHRRFEARIGADQQDRIGLVDAADAGVEDVAAARAVEHGAVLAAVDVGRAEARHQVLQRHHRFGVALIAGDGRDLAALELAQLLGDGREGLVPGRLDELAGLAHIRPVEPLVAQAVDGVTGLVGDPLLVDVVVHPRQHAHDLRAARVDADVGAQRIQHVDRLGLGELPRPRLVGVGLRGERAYRAEIDQVAGKLGRQRMLDVGRDLHATRRGRSRPAPRRPPPRWRSGCSACSGCSGSSRS